MEIKNRQQLLVVLAIVVVGLFAGDKIIFTPAMNAWNARNKRIADLKSNLKNGQATLKRESAIRSRWADWQHNALPNNPSAAEQKVFKSIDTWAGESGTVIAAMTPQWHHDADDYMTYQCRIDAGGSLASISRFLYEIERDPLALKLDSVEINARDKEGQQLSLGLQLSGLVLTTSK